MIKARWINGQAVPDEQVSWPEGSVVYLSRMPMSDETVASSPPQADDPASVAEWLKWYDSLQPLIFFEGEEAEIDRMRKQIADHSRQNMTSVAEGLFE